jgi:pilus assembly protein CpaF
MQIIERIVSSVGRRIDESSPMVDARLADGSRVNAIIPPLALDGPCLSIRRFRTDRLGGTDLVERQALTKPMLDFLIATVASRLNIVVCGGTGAGKTTLLNVLSGFISETERVITIEDAAELMLRQRHVVRLETRPPNIEGKGAVKQRDLVINALRMRPDRIIIGEVRGAEALDMLQAMNTGHDGSLTTIHANSPRDALYRLDTMVAMASLQLPERAVRQQIASAVDLIVQISRLSDGTRRVTAISEITGMENDIITIQDIFVFERTGVSSNGKVLGRFRATGIRPKCSERLAGRCRWTCSSTRIHQPAARSGGGDDDCRRFVRLDAEPDPAPTGVRRPPERRSSRVEAPEALGQPQPRSGAVAQARSATQHRAGIRHVPQPQPSGSPSAGAAD